MYRDYEHLRTVGHLIHGGLVLTPGRTYRVLVKFCAGNICYYSLKSNGTTIISSPPNSGNIAVEYDETNLKVNLT